MIFPSPVRILLLLHASFTSLLHAFRFLIFIWSGCMMSARGAYGRRGKSSREDLCFRSIALYLFSLLV